MALPEDLEAIYTIEKNSFSVPWSKESLEKELKNEMATYLIAVEEDKLIGYVGMWEVMGEGQITNIAIDRAYRGRGIGKRLLLDFIKNAKEKGLQMLILEVRQSNIIAQNLYQSVGFKEIACRKGYYNQPKEDALILQLVF